MGLCARRLAVLACLLAPSAVHAQLAPVGVPAGLLRVELDGTMDIWDHRWLDGARQPLGADLSSSALGSDLLPFLSDADARISRIIAQPGYRLNLGSLATDAQAENTRGFLGLAYGLTRGLTVFGRLPLVRVRVESHIALDSTSGDAGPNPGAASQLGFFQQLDASHQRARQPHRGGDFDGDPVAQGPGPGYPRRSATSLRDDLFGLLADPAMASPFVPTATSAPGDAIVSRVITLQTTLADDFGISGFTAVPALASQPPRRR